MARSVHRLVLMGLAPLLLCGTDCRSMGGLPAAFAGDGPAVLQLDLRADKAVYALGEPVELTLAVTNSSPDPVSVTAPSSQLYDFIVLGEGGEIWRWSSGRLFAAALTQLTIPSGRTRTFTERWAQRHRDGGRVNAGEYIVVGILIGGEQAALTPRRLRITIR